MERLGRLDSFYFQKLGWETLDAFYTGLDRVDSRATKRAVPDPNPLADTQ